MRVRYSNQPHRLKPEELQAVIDHIQSFRGRKSYYAMGATMKIYLPEDLNVAKMHQTFVNFCPAREVSIKRYRHVFNTTFNIGFGYPRKDTCNICDELKQKMLHAKSENNAESDRMKQELELYQRKAATF